MNPTPHDVLLVVDIQNDFCPGGALAVPEGDAVIPVIHRVAPLFHHVILTQDWHPEGHTSFASSYGARKPFEQVEPRYGQPFLQSLPPYRMTTNITDVEQFFGTAGR